MKKYIEIGLAVVVLGFLAYYFFQGEARKVRKQFTAIANAVSKPSGEGNIAMGVKMATLANLLNDTVVISIKDFPFNSEMPADELVSLASRGRTYFDYMEITILDVETEFTSKTTAVSRCAAKVRTRSKTGDYNYDEVREFTSDLVKGENKKWLFASFKQDDLLKK